MHWRHPCDHNARTCGIAGPCVAVRLLLKCFARPPLTACGVWVHLGGHGRRKRLRMGQNEPAHRTIGEWGAIGGRTSTGATYAVSASTRGSSGAQSSQLYMQRPLESTTAKAFGLPRSSYRK
jgi:hypothetical protein